MSDTLENSRRTNASFCFSFTKSSGDGVLKSKGTIPASFAEDKERDCSFRSQSALHCRERVNSVCFRHLLLRFDIFLEIVEHKTAAKLDTVVATNFSSRPISVQPCTSLPVAGAECFAASSDKLTVGRKPKPGGGLTVLSPEPRDAAPNPGGGRCGTTFLLDCTVSDGFARVLGLDARDESVGLPLSSRLRE